MSELFAIVSFHPESALFHPGRWPQRLRRARSPISTLREAVPMYASAQTLDFLAPFGAAPGNPEMTGRQTVRAMAKNAFFPNWKLLVSHPGFPDGNELESVRISLPVLNTAVRCSSFFPRRSRAFDSAPHALWGKSRRTPSRYRHLPYTGRCTGPDQPAGSCQP